MDITGTAAIISGITWFFVLLSLGGAYIPLAFGGFLTTWVIIATLGEIEEAVKKTK